MFLRRVHYSQLLAVVALAAPALATASEKSEVERYGSAVKSPDGDTALNPKNLRKSIQYAAGAPTFKIISINDSTPPEPKFDTENFKSDTRDITDLCFTSVGPWVQYGSSITSTETTRAMTCESRESIVKALGFTSVFLKGTGYICSFTPLPQAQIAAKVFDIASYASSSIALVVSVTHCEDKMEAKFNALIKACEDLRTMGVDCRGVDDSTF